jgi:hypothetical protein
MPHTKEEEKEKGKKKRHPSVGVEKMPTAQRTMHHPAIMPIHESS